jgi:hypothetical protein
MDSVNPPFLETQVCPLRVDEILNIKTVRTNETSSLIILTLLSLFFLFFIGEGGREGEGYPEINGLALDEYHQVTFKTNSCGRDKTNAYKTKRKHQGRQLKLHS